METNVNNFAICACIAGSVPNALIAMDNRTAVGGKTAATIIDVVFVATFGTCSITSSACSYMPAGPWVQAVGTVAFGGSAPLVNGATLLCVKGGIIKVIDPGQYATFSEQKA
jgi:hypothetical protein